MNVRARRKRLAVLGLFAYLWAGSGVASQLVYCIGSDGHAGIEQVHADASHHACEPGAEHSGGAELSHVDDCADVPLSVQASKQRDGVNDVLSASTVRALATVFAVASATSATTRPGGAVWPARSPVSILATTVLRV